MLRSEHNEKSIVDNLYPRSDRKVLTCIFDYIYN